MNKYTKQAQSEWLCKNNEVKLSLAECVIFTLSAGAFVGYVILEWLSNGY